MTLDQIRDRCLVEGDCWLWRQGINSGGYPQARINGQGGVMVRRYVYTLMHGRDVHPKKRIASRCENPLCCSPDHLVERTVSRVMEVSYERGARSLANHYISRLRHARNNGLTKLTIEQAREIRARLLMGETGAGLAREFGLHEKTVRSIKHNRTWREHFSGSSVFTWMPK
jgi:hypothetical protein